MKPLLTTATLVFSLFLISPASARPPGQAPVSPVAARPSVRPLTRYLAAMLRLTPQQAAAVQQALRNRPVYTLAPEDLTASLSPVLSPDAQQRLQSLQSDVTTYRTLYYLAARH